MRRNPSEVGALILAGGRGTRLVPLAKEFEKPLFVVDGQPLVRHAIDFAIGFGVGNIVVVTSPPIRNDIIDVLEESGADPLKSWTTVQPEPTGPADAIRIGLKDGAVALPWTLILCADNTFAPGPDRFRDEWRRRTESGSFIATRFDRDPEGRFTTVDAVGRLHSRRKEATLRARWIGPVLVRTTLLDMAVDRFDDVTSIEELLTRAAPTGFVSVPMECDDHGVAR